MTATEMIGKRVRELRERRGGMSAQALADRCAELGMPSLKRQAITNLENGRRGMVTVEELLLLAQALDVPPVMLFVPLDGRTRLRITPELDVTGLEALLWVTGEKAPKDPHRRAKWRETISPLNLHWRFWRVFEGADRREGLEDVAEFERLLEELGRTVDLMLESGITPPDLPPEWAQVIRSRGWTQHPDEVR